MEAAKYKTNSTYILVKTNEGKSFIDKINDMLLACVLGAVGIISGSAFFVYYVANLS